MGQTLENGVYLPSEGERNCYAGLKTNWEILDQKVADVTALQQAVAGALHREIVESLPTTDIDPNTIYMVLSGTSATENMYNEFMYVNNAWELIGTSATDLTNYYTKAEVDGKLLLKANASDLTSHTGDTTIHVTTTDKNKWNNQTYVFRYSSTALVASSTNSNTLLDNTDNLKVGDKVIDSSGVLFSITAIDTANSTFSIGTALIDLALDGNVVHTAEINSSGIGIIEGVKEVGGVDFNTLTTQGLYGANASGSTNNPVASPCVVQVIRRLNSVIQIANVSSSAYKSRYIRYCLDITAQSPVWQSWIKFATDDEVVHKSGDETVGGEKTFTSSIKGYNSDSTQSTVSIDLRTSKVSRGNTSDGVDTFGFGFRDKNNSALVSISCVKRSTGESSEYHTVNTTDSSNNVLSESYSFNLSKDGTATFRPETNDKTLLGTSTKRWKDCQTYLINGVEPSSLSLPRNTGYVDISSYFTNTGDGQINFYTASANGWIYLYVTAKTLVMQIKDSNNNSIYADIRVRSSDGTIYMTIPIGSGNKLLTQWFTSSSVTITTARFIPCQGNI